MDAPQYGIETQKLLLGYMLGDVVAFNISRKIVRADYFEDTLRKAYRAIDEHATKFGAMPTRDMVKAATAVDLPANDPTRDDREWYLTNIEGFCKAIALENAVLTGAALLTTVGGAAELERMVREASSIRLTTDLGVDLFDDPLALLTRRADRSSYIPTGWADVDFKLGGGFERGTLNLFCGSSGVGKSLFLQNIALNWLQAGRHVVYISLELSEDLVRERMAAMLLDRSTFDIQVHKEAYSRALMEQAKGYSGSLVVKRLAESATSANDLRAFLTEYEMIRGYKPDALVVDYLDLMAPNNARLDTSNLFNKDKWVSEELRSLGFDWNVPIVSATQLNRSALSTDDFDHSHVGGGLSKIHTADNAISISHLNKSKADGFRWREIQFLKTRSSDATGDKMKLGYNKASMRLTDWEEPVKVGDNTDLKTDTVSKGLF